ncbi:hypothetical protein E2C01_050676 [Portunus trituberculatus]|uniref:Ig-like domain-containing protein n=1 Tax=Portunus trituberculatus TaxID=210409 RepID=A0A5B7G9L8_PORTR|nr:hypothetical protein [Portunus trituberculatus]
MEENGGRKAGSLVAVTAVRGATAKLPCDVSSINPDDPVLLVLWYKNASLTPVYRYAINTSTAATNKVRNSVRKKSFLISSHYSECFN